MTEPDTTTDADTEDDGAGSDDTIRVGETRTDGTPFSLPVIEVLTGRAFLTGKSGAGKSNTASVVIEELLEAGYPVLIVDTDGEYYGLKEEYELLHAGADEECDIQVGSEHAEKLAALALEENVPIILDVSGYLDEEEADGLVRETARHLFAKEKKLKQPFLLVLEEVHEYIPEGAGMGETGRMLIKIGKRGRKHGLGVMGISQRPADVKKDFITQANWLVWHRLTWENDTKVVGRIVGSEYGDRVTDLDDGEAFVQADWTETAVHRIQFKRKRTFDAGATPGLDDFERPDLKSVSDALVGDLTDISEREERKETRIEELQDELAEKETRIQDLEDELERARDVSAAARQMANAFTQRNLGEFADDDDAAALREDLAEARDRIADLEAENDRLREEARTRAFQNPAASAGGPPASAPGGDSTPESSDATPAPETETASGGDAGSDPGPDADPDHGGTPGGDGANDRPRTADGDAGDPAEGVDDAADADRATGLASLREQAASLGPGGSAPDPDDGDGDGDGDAADADDDRDPAALVDLASTEGVVARVDAARRDSNCNEAHTWEAVTTLAMDGPLTVERLAVRVGVDVDAVQSLVAELDTRGLLWRDDRRRYDLDPGTMAEYAADTPREYPELREQWNTATDGTE